MVVRDAHTMYIYGGNQLDSGRDGWLGEIPSSAWANNQSNDFLVFVVDCSLHTTAQYLSSPVG